MIEFNGAEIHQVPTFDLPIFIRVSRTVNIDVSKTALMIFFQTTPPTTPRHYTRVQLPQINDLKADCIVNANGSARVYALFRLSIHR